MIEVKDGKNYRVISSNVTEFSDSVGYCEHKIPFFMEGLKAPPSQAVIRGSAMHEAAEANEKEQFVFEPITAAELADMTRNVEFAREDISTRLMFPIKAQGKPIMVILFGRADKIYRMDETLVVEEDKFPASLDRYQGRFEPFAGQKLQALAYLNSRFADGQEQGPDKWFDINHSKKEWVIRIMDREKNEPFRIYKGVQNEEAEQFLYSSIERFAYLVLGIVPREHHNTSSKCRPCGYKDRCEFRL